MTKMVRWPTGTPFVGIKPGDFIFSDEQEAPSATPSHIRFACPNGRGECGVPLHPNTTRKGATWRWDGNRDAPTLTPSINCLAHNPQDLTERYAGCGWHGFITKGEIK